MKIIPLEVEYIESGTFQGGEEEASIAGIEMGEDYIVIREAKFKELKKACEAAYETLAEVRTGEDFECACHDAGRKLRAFFEDQDDDE